MAMVFVSLNVWLVFVSDKLNVVSSCFFDGTCEVPLAPAAMTRIGSTFHPWLIVSLISGWYFRVLLFMVSWGNLSFVYVNSIICIVRWLAGSGGRVF